MFTESGMNSRAPNRAREHNGIAEPSRAKPRTDIGGPVLAMQNIKAANSARARCCNESKLAGFVELSISTTGPAWEDVRANNEIPEQAVSTTGKKEQLSSLAMPGVSTEDSG